MQNQHNYLLFYTFSSLIIQAIQYSFFILKLITSLWTVIIDYFLYFQTMDIFTIYLDRYQNSSCTLYPAVCWLPPVKCHVVAGVSKRNLCTNFTRRMIEGKQNKEKRGRSRVYNNNEANVFWAQERLGLRQRSPLNTLNKYVYRFADFRLSAEWVQWRHCRFSNVTIKQNRNLYRDGGKITGRNRNGRALCNRCTTFDAYNQFYL